MYRKFLVLTLVGVVTTACSATGWVNCEGNFYYDNSFTPEQQGWIEEASLRWNTWAGHKVTSVRPGSEHSCTISVGKTTKESAIGEEEQRLQNIVVDVEDLTRLKKLDKAHIEGVVMHEMGHALGYGHVGANNKALMAPAGSLDFTDIDRVECIKKDMCTTLNPPIPATTDSDTLPDCNK
jgi:hypothetical protein